MRATRGRTRIGSAFPGEYEEEGEGRRALRRSTTPPSPETRMMLVGLPARAAGRKVDFAREVMLSAEVVVWILGWLLWSLWGKRRFRRGWMSLAWRVEACCAPEPRERIMWSSAACFCSFSVPFSRWCCGDMDRLKKDDSWGLKAVRSVGGGFVRASSRRCGIAVSVSFPASLGSLERSGRVWEGGRSSWLEM